MITIIPHSRNMSLSLSTGKCPLTKLLNMLWIVHHHGLKVYLTSDNIKVTLLFGLSCHLRHVDEQCCVPFLWTDQCINISRCKSCKKLMLFLLCMQWQRHYSVNCSLSIVWKRRKLLFMNAFDGRDTVLYMF